MYEAMESKIIGDTLYEYRLQENSKFGLEANKWRKGLKFVFLI